MTIKRGIAFDEYMAKKNPNQKSDNDNCHDTYIYFFGKDSYRLYRKLCKIIDKIYNEYSC